MGFQEDPQGADSAGKQCSYIISFWPDADMIVDSCSHPRELVKSNIDAV